MVVITGGAGVPKSAEPSYLAGPARIYAATSLRYRALVGIGVLGTIATLLSGLDGLVALSERARWAIAYWRTLTLTMWSWIVGWIGIRLPHSLLALFNFALFGMLLAVGVRIRAKYFTDNTIAISNTRVRVSAGRIIISFLVMAILSLLSLVILAILQMYGVTLTIEAIAAIWIAWSLLIMTACFLWTHRFSKHALQLFPLALIYSGCVFLAPFLKELNPKSYLDMILFLVSLAAINLIFSLMLLIAPAIALRNRLGVSVLLALLVVLPVLGPLGLAQIYAMRGNALLADDRNVEALTYYQKSLVIREMLSRGDPTNLDRQTDLGVYYSKVGDLLSAANRREEAIASYEKALAIGEGLVSSAPKNTLHQRNLGIYYRQAGDVLATGNERDKALANYRKAVVIGEKLAGDDPAKTDWQIELDLYYSRLGDILRADDRNVEALTYYQKSLAIREMLSRGDPTNLDRQTDLGVYYSKVGDLLSAANRREEAIASYEKALAIGEGLVSSAPKNTLHQRNLGIYYRQAGDVLATGNERDKALANYRKAVVIGEKLAGDDPAKTDWQIDLDLYYSRLGDILRADDRIVEALPYYLKSLAIRRKLAGEDPANADKQSKLAAMHRMLGVAFTADNKHEAAIENFYAALAISEHHATETENLEQATNGTLSALTAEALTAVAWGLLFVRNFERALALTERALRLDPDSLAIQTNRAHALLFLGQLDEARALYIAHKGERISQTNSKIWEEVIADDLKELREAGLDHPVFIEILSALQKN